MLESSVRRSKRRGLLVAAASACAVLALAGCAPSTEVDLESASAAASTSRPAGTGPPSTQTSDSSPDAVDVTTWTITPAGIGPVQRGAVYPDAISSLAEFEATESSELCSGAITLSRDEETAELLVRLDGERSQVTSIWVAGRPGADGASPASPATPTGIRLGSTRDELVAAYPDLSSVAQIGPDAYCYAVGDDANGWIDFVVEGGRVVTVGSSERPQTPRSICD